MGDKDLENIIRAVASTENDAVQKQKEIERLYELIETQKKKIADLEKDIQDQSAKVALTASLPPDVELLKQRVGELHEEVNQKDAMIEAKFIEINRLKADLNFLRNQLNDTSQDLQRSSSEAGTIRATLAEKNKQLEAKCQELQEKSDALARLETNSYDVLKLRQELDAAQDNLLAREKIILEKDAKIAELEGKLGQSQVAAETKEALEKLQGELSAKDFDLKMQEGTIKELREQLEDAKRRADQPDPNAGRIETLSKQLQQQHNENAKLSLQIKLLEERVRDQQAKIVTYENAIAGSESKAVPSKVQSGAQFTKKIIMHTSTKEERHFEI
jgi:chromosome segregation ATPase